MKKRNLLLVILAVLLVFGLVVGCGPADDEDGTKPGTTNTATLNSVGQVGGSATATTTAITLTFNKAIAGLSASDITLGGSTGATKGTLSGTGPTYTLPITGVTASGDVSVTVAKTGWTISGSPKTVAIFYLSAQTAASDFFSGYVATYRLSSGNTNEYLKFEGNKLVLWDTTNDGGHLNYIQVEITKWDYENSFTWTAGANDHGPDEFNGGGFKLTCKIKGGFPITESGANKCIYGTRTAPGFNTTDINTTTVYIYLYFQDDDGDLAVVRSIFTSDGSSKVPITGSDSDSTIRYYRENPSAANYPTIN